MFKKFKSLVNKAVDQHIKLTREEAEKKFGYIFNNEQSLELYLYQLIKEKLEVPYNNRPISKSKFYKISEDLINRFVLAREDYNPYFEIIKIIKVSCNTERSGLCNFDDDNTQWLLAIEIALVVYELETYHMDHIAMKDYYREFFDRANSIKYLKEQGCPVELTDEDVNITADKIFQDIEKEVNSIGGHSLSFYIFKYLSQNNKYSKLFDRFNIIREPNVQGFGKPQIPFGYLLNLCAKYPHSSNAVTTTQINSLFHKAALACNATYPVQHYNLWRYFFNAHEDTFELMTELALWDTIFSIPQARAAFQLEFVEYLISQFDHINFEELLGFKTEDFFKVCSTIFSTEEIGPCRFTAIKISEITNLDISTVTAVLNSISHNKSANNQYFIPSDGLNLDYQFKPLIRNNDNYVLFWKSWNVLSLFETIASIYRKVDKNFDGKVGFILESYLQKKMSQNDIISNTGKYKVGNIDGEADLVIETENKIVLIEVKKKVLTRKAKSGNDVSLIIDLSETVIDASIQSSRTELLLRKHGQLKLVREDGSSYLLDWKNREFEHISLSHMDFGGMQNNSVMQNLRVALLIYKWFVIDDTDSRSVKKFNELQDKQAELGKQYDELMKQKAMFEHNPYFDNWFLNYNHLLEVINLSCGNENFYQNLIKSKHMSSGSLDFYKDFEINLGISESENYKNLAKLSEQKKARIIPLSNINKNS